MASLQDQASQPGRVVLVKETVVKEQARHQEEVELERRETPEPQQEAVDPDRYVMTNGQEIHVGLW